MNSLNCDMVCPAFPDIAVVYSAKLKLNYLVFRSSHHDNDNPSHADCHVWGCPVQRAPGLVRLPPRCLDVHVYCLCLHRHHPLHNRHQPSQTRAQEDSGWP